jgi:uncharacterized membrane protein
VSQTNRLAAFIAYLVPVFGPLYVFLARREQRFECFHARQSLALTLVLIGGPLLWLVFAWLMLWVPAAGPVIAAAFFALVILAVVFVVVLWVAGLINAVRGQYKSLPITGRWAERLPVGAPRFALS